MRKRLIVGLIFVVCGSSQALTSLNHSCRIVIQMTKTNGETQNFEFASPLKSKEQCRALAQLHRKNFNPEIVKTKRVSFFWKKTKKTIPILAKASRKHSRKNKHSRFKSL